MLKQSNVASVVLFSSVAVKQGMAYHASIASAKGAVEGLVRSLAAEFSPVIRFNGIAPSLTETRLSERLINTDQKLEKVANNHPLRRIGQPEDIAKLACFLLSDASSWITGEIIHIDGGMSSIKELK